MAYHTRGDFSEPPKSITRRQRDGIMRATEDKEEARLKQLKWEKFSKVPSAEWGPTKGVCFEEFSEIAPDVWSTLKLESSNGA